MSSNSADYLRSQRTRPVVLKSELAKIRGSSRCALVFVLEGKDDLVVYDVWVRRLLPNLTWEPLIAHGKANVLEFRKMLERDKTGLRTCTYFIIDHDYDGLRGFPAGEDIYVLPAYSVENYLVGPQVFESILRADLHVLGDIETRNRVVDKYEKALDTFAELVRPSCELLFGAKGETVGNVNIDDSAISGIRVAVGGVVVVDVHKVSNIVNTENPVSALGVKAAEKFFSTVSLREWIRGKFLYSFFKTWVTAVFEDRRSEKPTLFEAKAEGLTFSPASLDMRCLAARSPMPGSLREFVQSRAVNCHENCQQ